MTDRRDYRSFRKVIEAGAAYREAESEADFMAARLALATAIIRWEFNVPDEGTIAVDLLPLHEQTSGPGKPPGGWHSVTEAIVWWPDEVPFGRPNTSPFFRLYAAAQRWARRVKWSVTFPPAGVEVPPGIEVVTLGPGESVPRGGIEVLAC